MDWDFFFQIGSDQALLSQFIEFVQEKIYTTLASKKINSQDIDDIVQNTCLSIAENFLHLQTICKNSEHLKNYIYKMSRNSIRDHIRKKNRVQNLEISIEIEDSPQKKIMEQELMDTLHGCMGKLNNNWLEVLIWDIVDGKTADEILQTSGIPKRTQRLWKQKAKENLKNCVEINV